MDKQGKMTLFCVLHFKNDVLTYYFGVCSDFLASAFQDHPTFGYMVEAIYRSILFLSFVKRVLERRERMFLMIGGREEMEGERMEERDGCF